VTRRLHIDRTAYYSVGLNEWFLVPGRRALGVLKVRNGVIVEIGIADKRLIRGRKSALRFFLSFSAG
jgi:hypothetical protein